MIDAEAERIIRDFPLGIVAHFNGMGGIVAPDAINTADRKHGLGSDHGQGDDRGAFYCEVWHHISIALPPSATSLDAVQVVWRVGWPKATGSAQWPRMSCPAMAGRSGPGCDIGVRRIRAML